MVTARLERIVGYVRRWRTYGDGGEALVLAPELPDADLKRLRRVIDQCIDAQGGEVAARRKARSIGTAFSGLDAVGRRRFFELLANEYGGDDDAVDRAIDLVVRARDRSERSAAEAELRRALEPRRERLFRRFAGLDGGLPFLVGLREDLLGHRDDEALDAVDRDLRQILEGWFDVALLRLERLRWDSPAALLERLIQYEAVHAIESWDDLKGRLGPGRRCYAFLHPAMPDDPLIFVEVALTKGIASSLPSLLDHRADRVDEAEADAAIFYSISNCHRGLAGVSLGDFLIKSVAEQLSAELPSITDFATLSPLPGFRRWVERSVADGDLVIAPGEAEALTDGSGVDGEEPTALAAQRLAQLISGPVPDGDDRRLAVARPLLMRLAAEYLTRERKNRRSLDPVANFHLSNGATIGRLNWWANPNAAGWERGLGIMVNYHYQLRHIERNHDRYVGEGTVTAADGVRKLLTPVEPSRKSQ
ncbi:MAG: malonyl-CoA decarboxylase family protein [Actinomycetota bacterium]